MFDQCSHSFSSSLVTDLQLPDLGERDLDVLALEGVARLGELPQLVRVLVEPLALGPRTLVVEGVDEDGGQVALRMDKVSRQNLLKPF